MGDDTYSTYFLGDNALFFAYQAQPRVSTDVDIDSPSNLHKQKINMDYVLHPRGIKFTGSANPTDSAIGTASNWDEAYQDHRHVKLAKLLTKGQVYAA